MARFGISSTKCRWQPAAGMSFWVWTAGPPPPSAFACPSSPSPILSPTHLLSWLAPSQVAPTITASVVSFLRNPCSLLGQVWNFGQSSSVPAWVRFDCSYFTGTLRVMSQQLPPETVDKSLKDGLCISIGRGIDKKKKAMSFIVCKYAILFGIFSFGIFLFFRLLYTWKLTPFLLSKLKLTWNFFFYYPPPQLLLLLFFYALEFLVCNNISSLELVPDV